MDENVLNVAEKTKLTDYAREVVARNNRAANAPLVPVEEQKPVDAFSPEGLMRRISALEKSLAALDRRIEQNSVVFLSFLERLEAKCAHASGEVLAIRDELDAQAGKTNYLSDELSSAAKEYGAILRGELTQLVNRLEQICESASAFDVGR